MSTPSSAELTVLLRLEEGEVLGITPDEHLTITKVQAGTVAEGHLRIGDQIKSINGRACSNREHYFRLARVAHPECRLVVVRSSDPTAAGLTLPPEREALLQRRAGYSYQLVDLQWTPGGARLGLAIKHHHNRVLVCRLDQDGTAKDKLLIGDRIVDVGGTPVSDKDVAKLLIVNALGRPASNGTVSLSVERPNSLEATKFIADALKASEKKESDPPSIRMPDDVVKIMKDQRKAIKAGQLKEPVSILRKPGGGQAPAARNVGWSSGTHKEVQIVRDTDPNKQLRSVH